MFYEPTSALDPISTSKIEELAMELKGKYTIVIVTHNMQQAVRISDRTAFFLLGEMVEFGGLLGYAPIMPVNQFGCDAFVNRGGRIPAPIHSFKN